MNIVLDSNAVYKDYLLDSAPMRTFEHYLSWTSDRLVVPQVVIEEGVRHFRDDCEQADSSLSKARNLAIVLGVPPPSLPDSTEASSAYRGKLLQRLTELKARILAFPLVTTDVLFKRYIEVRRPFDRAGKGLADTLIWLSIIDDLMANPVRTILVSQDGDFEHSPKDRSRPPVLHSDLVSDLLAAKLDPALVEPRRTLHEFNEEFAKPLAKRVYREGEQIKGSFAASLDPTKLLEMYGEAAARKIHEDIGFILPLGHGYADEISFVRWPENARLLEALDLGEDVLQAIIRTFLVFDAQVHVPEDSSQRLLEFILRRGILMVGPLWDQQSSDFFFSLRVPLFADFIVHWDSRNDRGKAFALLRFGSTEEETNASPLALG